uniref:Uncharacterized protein n=1 Tax=Saimiriine herpesvirus 2 (strain 488) TaxID=10384 RepID=Q80BQ0_SHV2C|nr:hypothetical protein [Saimiriine gammaherpesvirus 2]
MQEDIPNILYVSREEDGRIVEMIVTEKHKEKYVYYPYSNKSTFTIEDTKLFNIANFSLIIQWITYTLFYSQAVIIFILYCWALNPYRSPGNSVLGGLGQRVPRTVVHINPRNIFEGCDKSIICKLRLPMPIINTTHGKIYPNFTKTDGSSANYKLALERLVGLMNNQQCNVEIISQKKTVFSSQNVTFFENVKSDAILALLVLQKNCHPESVEIVKSKIKLENYGVNYRQHMPQYFTVCNASWADVINNTNYNFKTSDRPCNTNYLLRYPQHVPYIINVK